MAASEEDHGASGNAGLVECRAGARRGVGGRSARPPRRALRGGTSGVGRHQWPGELDHEPRSGASRRRRPALHPGGERADEDGGTRVEHDIGPAALVGVGTSAGRRTLFVDGAQVASEAVDLSRLVDPLTLALGGVALDGRMNGELHLDDVRVTEAPTGSRLQFVGDASVPRGECARISFTQVSSLGEPVDGGSSDLWVVSVTAADAGAFLDPTCRNSGPLVVDAGDPGPWSVWVRLETPGPVLVRVHSDDLLPSEFELRAVEDGGGGAAGGGAAGGGAAGGGAAGGGAAGGGAAGGGVEGNAPPGCGCGVTGAPWTLVLLVLERLGRNRRRRQRRPALPTSAPR